jgi:hypothetical protein
LCGWATAPHPEATQVAGYFGNNTARTLYRQGPKLAATYFLCGGVKNGDGVADVVFLSFLGFFASRLLFF